MVKKVVWGVIGVFGFIVACTVVIGSSGRGSQKGGLAGVQQPTAAVVPTATSRLLSVGREGWLGGPKRVFAPVDDAAWDAMFKAAGAKDEMGLQQLVIGGRVLLVEPYTKVLSLENSFTATKVRILEGKHIGKAAWVLHEDVSP